MHVQIVMQITGTYYFGVTQGFNLGTLLFLSCYHSYTDGASYLFKGILRNWKRNY